MDGAELFKVTNLGLFKRPRMNTVIVFLRAPTLIWFSSCPLHKVRALNELSREIISSFASKCEIVSYR